VETIVYCGNQHCGIVLKEPVDISEEKRQPCPECGSLSRAKNLKLSDETTVKDFIDIKKKSEEPHKFPSRKKQRVHLQQGDQINHETGKWISKVWRVDKDISPAWYTEILIDTETGKIIKHVEEPLDQHQGHGSDKKK